MAITQSTTILITRVQLLMRHVYVMYMYFTSYTYTPVTKELHWLYINQQIVYKILIITYKALKGLAPSSICDMLQALKSTMNLRSSMIRVRAALPCWPPWSTCPEKVEIIWPKWSAYKLIYRPQAYLFYRK